jgi:hypothetical protein
MQELPNVKYKNLIAPIIGYYYREFAIKKSARHHLNIVSILPDH